MKKTMLGELDEKFNNKFCKVVIKTDLGDKALKGIVTFFDQNLSISGDYQNTMVHLSEVIRITTKEGGGIKK